MTYQIPDSCLYQGRRWEVEDLGNFYDILPSNEDLGFNTVSVATNNWSGRIDHFVVCNNSLYLHKIEVNLAPEYEDFIPPGAGKEIITRYEPMTVTDKNGTRDDWWKHVFHYFVFGGGDHRLEGTGKIILRNPYRDLWEYPSTEKKDDIFPAEERAILTFEDGCLVDEEVDYV